MYGLFGGCTTLFHLAVRYPVLVLALGLAGFVSQVPSNPGPGDRLGTDGLLRSSQNRVMEIRSGLPTRVDNLKTSFSKLNAIPSQDQIQKVLMMTDACTDTRAEDVLSDPDMTRDTAWLLYLDTVSREGVPKADLLFNNRNGPSR